MNCWKQSLKTVTIENCGRADNNRELESFFMEGKIDGMVECIIKNNDAEYWDVPLNGKLC